MPITADNNAEILRVVEHYYDIADHIAAATAAGCRLLRADPFATALRQEKDLRSQRPGC